MNLNVSNVVAKLSKIDQYKGSSIFFGVFRGQLELHDGHGKPIEMDRPYFLVSDRGGSQ